ncbi:DUF2127 domain-containing protein [Oleiagrimonas sp.]|jgi:uncharacterized membrane protein|uniref:DUF2127 domain-containing protein n=1 Tax=Oleiagrimonas sp. TaxID=2010330 RepID=UPI002615A0D2|nr:DUF2127 domain-containing protein [Oleiagrimonas sp.]MDA3913309.1 DUF2127 domain-containing protein [Oleiagrimonas sp.]
MTNTRLVADRRCESPLQGNSVLDTKKERLFRWAFDVGVWLKGLDGALEVLAGALLLLVSKDQIVRAVHWLIGTDLIENPDGFIAIYFRHLAGKLSVHAHYFAGFYLVGHGVIKIGLVIGLLRDKRWAYPSAVVFLLLFIGYQSYRLTQVPTLLLGALTVVDVVVIILIIHEWRWRASQGYPALH